MNQASTSRNDLLHVGLMNQAPTPRNDLLHVGLMNQAPTSRNDILFSHCEPEWARQSYVSSRALRSLRYLSTYLLAVWDIWVLSLLQEYQTPVPLWSGASQQCLQRSAEQSGQPWLDPRHQI